MVSRSVRRRFNLGNLLILAGLVGLGVSLALPYLTSQRVARVERRAFKIAQLLMAIAQEHISDLEFEDPQGQKAIEAELRRKIQADGSIPESSIPSGFTPDGLSGYYFRERHYLYLLTRTPADRKSLGFENLQNQSLEVYAWPHSNLSGGREVFFLPGDSGAVIKGHTVQAVRSRNLLRHYLGTSPMPIPGAGRPREEIQPGAKWYRGQDDERWIAFK